MWVSFVSRPNLPPELQQYLNSKHSLLLSGNYWELAFGLLFLLLFVVSFGGLYFFWPPARIFYCALLVVGIVGALCLGPRVQSGWVAAMDDIASMLAGIIFYVAFFSPVRERFRKEKGARNSVSSQ